MGIARMRCAPLAQILINPKLFPVRIIACIYFQCHILMASDCISLSPIIEEIRADLLQVTTKPHCGGDAKSQLTNDLVFGTIDVTNIDRIILPFLELFKTFLVKYLGCIDCFEAAGWKTHRRGGDSSKGIFGPFQERGHGDGTSIRAREC